MDHEAAESVLAARARALAAPLEDARAPVVASSQVMRFTVGDETYGVEARQLRGVFRLVSLAPLCGSSSAVAGLTLWRGDLLVVLDLQEVLGRGISGLDDRAWVVVISDSRRSRGLLARFVVGLAAMDPNEVRPLKSSGEGSERRFVQGMSTNACQVLDVDNLLHHVDMGGEHDLDGR